MKKKPKSLKEKYESYLEITKDLDDSERMVRLKQAIWNQMLKKRDKKKRS